MPRYLQDARDAFVQRVGHELRTPLTPLMGYLDLLTATLVPEEEADLARARR